VDDPTRYAPWLWLLTLLFLARVAGQVVVRLFHPRWLPPMEHWYSGLLPYRFLLPAQIAILAVMLWICRRFSLGTEEPVAPRPGLGHLLIGLGIVYLAGMAARYTLRMARRPDQRWLAGIIPIVFHCVLAAFLLVLGVYHAA
jgi:hypothetical protein